MINTIREIQAHAGMGYKVVCLDAAALIDSPLSRRSIRCRGGCDTVKINYSKQSIKIIGPWAGTRWTYNFTKTWPPGASRIARGDPAKIRERVCHNGQRGGSQEQGHGGFIRDTNRSVASGSCPRTPHSKTPSRYSGGRSSGQWQTRSLVDLTNYRRGSKRCWMPVRCPEQDWVHAGCHGLSRVLEGLTLPNPCRTA